MQHHLLPFASIQPTFRSVIADVRNGVVPFESVWLSCYKQGESSIHGKIMIALDEVDRDKVILTSSHDDVSLENENPYRVSCQQLGIESTRLILPKIEYSDSDRANPRQPHRITAFDVSPDGSQFASGFLDGSVLLYPSSQGSAARPYGTSTRSLKTSITQLQYFPSSRVLLSAAMDFALHILPADAEPAGRAPKILTPARELTGHTKTITGTAIIGRGRKVLSSAMDGTIRKWDVASGTSTLLTLSRSFAPVTSIALAQTATESSGLVLATLDSGSFEGIDLSSDTPIHTSTASTGSLTTVAVRDTLVATGSSQGIVQLFDIRASWDTPLSSFRRGTTAILDLTFITPETLAVTDGSPYMTTFSSSDGAVKVESEIVGADCDPTTHIRISNDELWTASDDGVVRRYNY